MALDVILVRLLVVAAVASVLPVPGRADAGAGLAVGFYNKTCPRAEELVLEEMRDIVHGDPTLGPALLRLLFHDCFVRGCDGSIMLKSKSKTGERDAMPMSATCAASTRSRGSRRSWRTRARSPCRARTSSSWPRGTPST